MEIIETYIQGLLEKSTVEVPIWNVEKLKESSKSNWNYIDGCMIKALIEVYRITGDRRYLEFSDKFIGHRVQEDGTISGYKIDNYNLDDINAGKTLFELYYLTGREKYALAIETVHRQIIEQPRCDEGNFWHKKIYPYQVWLDGLYMALPFYMEYETKMNDRKNYNDIFRQFFNVYEIMRNKETGLYYHGYDSSRQVFWCNKETGLSANHWLRATGWYAMALLDTLQQCDSRGCERDYEKLKKIYRELMDTMLRYRDDSGMWYQVIDCIGRDKNYPETSGTAIMAYSLLKGTRLGYLPESYWKEGEKAFNAICERYLEKTEDGLSLGGICLVAGLGPENNKRRDGSYEYYMSEPVVKDDAKGVGPFLLAYTELMRQRD